MLIDLTKSISILARARYALEEFQSIMFLRSGPSSREIVGPPTTFEDRIHSDIGWILFELEHLSEAYEWYVRGVRANDSSARKKAIKLIEELHPTRYSTKLEVSDEI
jgi:hypothetical protein